MTYGYTSTSPWVNTAGGISSFVKDIDGHYLGQPDYMSNPAYAQPGSSSSASASLSSLFTYPELKIPFDPINDALTRQMKTAEGYSSEMHDWANQRAAQQDATAKQAIDYQLGVMRDAGDRAKSFYDDWKTKYSPLDDQLVKEAKDSVSDAGLERAASTAAADMGRQFGAQEKAAAQKLLAMGVNPNSGRFAAIAQQGLLDRAATTAGAMTGARERQKQAGIGLLGAVAQSGRGLLDVSNANTQLANAAGTGATTLENQTAMAIANEKGAALAPLNTAADIAKSLGNFSLTAYKSGMDARVAAANALGKASGYGLGGATGGGTVGATVYGKPMSGFDNWGLPSSKFDNPVWNASLGNYVYN